MNDKEQGAVYWDNNWNFITGCTPISPACENCYAKRMAPRIKGRHGYPEDEPFRVTMHPDKMDQPTRWTKRRIIFPVNMGDIMHDDVPNKIINEAITVMANTPHIYLVLTKRAERLARFKPEWIKDGGIRSGYWPSNVWVGVTAENQEYADKRLKLLNKVRAMHRWASLEPLLGPVDLEKYIEFLNWIVVGGESGRDARPMLPEWARQVRDICKAACVPFFFKQYGEWLPDEQKMPFHTFNIQKEPRDMIPVTIRRAGNTEQTGRWYKVGAKKSGRYLDGRTHDEKPKQWEVSHT